MLNLDGLRQAMPKLGERDREFADNLLASVEKFGGLTPRQEPWVDRLIERANGGGQRKIEKVGDLSKMMALFGRAKQHLKSPALVIGLDGVGEVCLSVAKAHHRVPGSVNVAINAPFGSPANKWFGRILADGNFEVSPRQPLPETLIEQLRDFAEHPAERAAAHGKLTGRCCFCDHKLTDPKSTAVGYGQTCAKNFGLPWGAKASGKDLFCDEAAMQRLEAQDDREQTTRDERAKHLARMEMES